MANIIEYELQDYSEQPITQSILMDLLQEYSSPHNKIQALEKKNMLTPVKRGLYIAGPVIRGQKPSVYALANHIYGPSYISLEAALSYWGLIPERVATISSMTTGSTKTFTTALGLFTYTRTRLPYYSFGIKSAELDAKQVVLIASPEKAICDIIISRTGVNLRSVRQAQLFLEEDLRIERDILQNLDIEAIKSWIPNAPKKSSLLMLIKTLEAL